MKKWPKSTRKPIFLLGDKNRQLGGFWAKLPLFLTLFRRTPAYNLLNTSLHRGEYFWGSQTLKFTDDPPDTKKGQKNALFFQKLGNILLKISKKHSFLRVFTPFSPSIHSLPLNIPLFLLIFRPKRRVKYTFFIYTPYTRLKCTYFAPKIQHNTSKRQNTLKMHPKMVKNRHK